MLELWNKTCFKTYVLLFLNIGLIASKSMADNVTDNDLELQSDTADQYCTDREVVDKFKNIILPNDYRIEPIERFDHRFVINSMDDYKHAYNHLKAYKDNVSSRAEPLGKVLANHMKDYLLTLPFEPKCFQSLTAISSALKSNEQWAIKCELRSISLILIDIGHYFVQ